VFMGYLRQAVINLCGVLTLDPDESINRNCNFKKQKFLQFSAISEK
jgi:hypothetical protein